MTLDLSNVCANPFLMGCLGAFIIEGYSLIKSLQVAMYREEFFTIITIPYMIVRGLRIIFLPFVGGAFAYVLANSPGAPVWQLIVGATSIGFFEKVSGDILKFKYEDSD